MDPLTTAPRIIGWLPIIALAFAALAAVLWRRSRGRDRGDGPGLFAVLPFLLLFVAAATAVASSAAEAALDSRVGIREASMLGLGVLCATPAAGWLIARIRWGPPGRRSFYEQIASNRSGAIVLLLVLGELLALMGFVVGGSIGVLFGAAFIGGLIGAAAAVVGSVIAAVRGIRHGADVLLLAVHATPAGEGHQVLRNVVTELSLAANIPAPKVFVIADPSPNALALGSDPAHASIAVTTGLLERLTREELQGVIAHELAHIRNLDSRYGTLVAVFVGGVIVLAAVFAQLMSNWSIGGDSVSEIVVSVLILIVAAAIGWLVRGLATAAALAIQASVSREREFLADASAVEINRNPVGLIGALAKIDDRRLPIQTGATANTRHLWFVAPLTDNAPTEGWLATHPTTRDRISRLRDLSTELDRIGPAQGVPLAEPRPDPAESPTTGG